MQTEYRSEHDDSIKEEQVDDKREVNFYVDDYRVNYFGVGLTVSFE